MTDQNTFPDGHEHGSPTGSAPETDAWSATPPPPAESPDVYAGHTQPLPVEPADVYAGYTQPLPPYQQPAAPAATAPARRTRGIAAGVLAGALLLGGAAGVGGAAWYDAWQGDDTSGVADAPTSGGVSASNVANVPDGSVEKVAAVVLPSVVKINVSGQSGSGSGSGVVLKPDGTILTNNHVVSVANRGGGSITVNLHDGRTVRAKILGTDPVTDMAVIKAEDVSDLTPATIGKSGSLKVGQAVVAVGSPFGLNATVTTGIVSALNRPVSVQSEEEPQQLDPFGFGQQQRQQSGVTSTTYPAIQTDAAINPGNSGGPLVDLAGRVVGINSSIRTSGSSALTGAGGSIGLGFAIPIDEVLPIVNQIIDGQEPTHARLAISVSNVQSDTLAQGALVRTVEKGGPADEAGLKAGDVITKVDEQVVDGSESLIATIRGHRPGEKVELTYLRNGNTRTTTATLGSDAETTQS